MFSRHERPGAAVYFRCRSSGTTKESAGGHISHETINPLGAHAEGRIVCIRTDTFQLKSKQPIGISPFGPFAVRKLAA